MDGYQPIKTKADRDVENVNALKDAVIGIGKGVGKAFGEAIDRLLPQGANETANALFNGSAYWPGEHPKPLTDPQPQQEESHGVHGTPDFSARQETSEASQSVNDYMSGYARKGQSDRTWRQ